MNSTIYTLIFAVLFSSFPMLTQADDWPMRGRNMFRQSWIENEVGPQTWEPKVPPTTEPTINGDRLLEARVGQVKWKAGGFWEAMCDPVVAHGLVWIGTADPIGESTKDSGVLACFDAQTGKLLYQHISEKLGDAHQDWPITGNTSSPFIEGNRLWFCTNRLEVICMNIQPLIERTGEPTILWTVDMKTRFNVVPKDIHLGNRASRCSIVGVDGRIFVNTTHSFAYERDPHVDPNVPSFVCLNQNTGETIWTDSSPGNKIARNQHCNPVIYQSENKNYVAIGQGDGYVRAFDCESGKPIWQFDLNTQQARSQFGNNAFLYTRLITESPVFDGRHLYFVIGNDREATYEPGGIFCIDPFGKGDVSRDILVNGQRQINNNSKLVWEYSSEDGAPIKTSISGLCVTSTLLFESDVHGIVRCFDKLSGKLHWKHDLHAAALGTPLVVGDTLYVADQDGDIEVLRASANYEPITDINHEQPIESSPVYANDTLYFVTRQQVFAIGK